MYDSIHLQTTALCWRGSKASDFSLTNIDFNAQRGRFVGLLGPNGSGKTTLLRCLYRGLSVDAHMIQLDGKSLNSFSRQALAKKIAVVFQQQPEEISLNVDEILKLGRLPHGSLFSAESAQFTDSEQKLVQELDLQHLCYRPYESLSGGEKQRVMIARALIQKPEILLMDEPTNHLDIAHQIAVLDYISKLDITVICSLHDLNLAAQFCDELAVLKDGQLVTQGCVEDVLTPALIQSVFSVNAITDRHPVNGALRLSFY